MNRWVDVIPAKEDWGDISGDLDAIDAYTSFGGCTNSRAQRLFACDILARAQDLRFMPPRPFVYYMKAFCDLVLSENYGDSRPAEIADAFLSVSTSRATELILVGEVAERVLAMLVNKQIEYGAEPSIYGDFAERAADIRRLSRPGWL